MPLIAPAVSVYVAALAKILPITVLLSLFILIDINI
jgi:hypothetical protein